VGVALLVAACGSSGHSSSSAATAPASSSTTTSSAPATSSSSTAIATASSSTATTSMSTTSARRAKHHAGAAATSTTTSSTSTKAPESTPHFIVELSIGAGDTVKPASIGVAGHTQLQLAVANKSGAAAKLTIVHKKTLFSLSCPDSKTTTATLPALSNTGYVVEVNGRPRAVLLVGVKAGP
jgi:hypothetical protein